MHGCKIIDIETYLPARIETNEELVIEFPEWSPSKILKKIGIAERHIAAPEETALDLAREACQKLLARVDKQSIDFIILCTITPDFLFPATACMLQDQLGLPKTVGALDVNMGCSGFIYSLALVKGIISAKIAKNVLLVTTDTFSKHVNPREKGNRTLFGDGAAVCLVVESDINQIHEFEFGTDGSGWVNINVLNKGMRNPFNPKDEDWIDEAGALRNDNYVYMNGPEVFNFAVDVVPNLLESVCKKNQTTLAEIDYFIFHQANQYMLGYLRDLMNIPEEKFYLNMLHTGNTISTTIPIAMKDALDNGIIKKGDKVLIAGFGVGFSYGASVITI